MHCRLKTLVSMLIFLLLITLSINVDSSVFAACSHKVSDWSEVTATQHKGQCLKCGVIVGYAHNNPPSCTKAGQCSQCDYIRKALGHYYKGDVEYDQATTEFHVKVTYCTRCNSSKEENQSHSFNSENQCTACKYVKACSHTYSSATCTKAATCTKCGQTRGSALGHNYSGKIEYDQATTEFHIKSSYCTRCNNLKEEKENHSFDSENQCTACKYVKVCSHTYSSATCTKAATCTKCGQTKGTKLGHNVLDWSSVTPTNHSGSCSRCGIILGYSHDNPPSCTKDGQCSECDYIRKALGHNYNGKVEYDQATTEFHIKVTYCTRCNDSKEEKQKHSFNSDDQCTACKYVQACSHTYSSATCTKAARCTKCGETKGTKLGHNVLDWSDITPTNHSGSCSRCGIIITENHKADKATCTTSSKCSECDYILKMAIGHQFVTEYQETSEKEHILIKKCSECKYTTETVENHNFGGKGKCENCGYVIMEITVEPDPNVDKTSKEYKVRCNNDKINRLHTITFNYMKITAKTHNFVYTCKECNFKSTEIRNKKHKFDSNGKCECGRQACTEEKLIEGHKLKITYKKSTDSAVKELQHIVVTKCTECNVAYEALANHTFNEKGVCTVTGCGYKNPLKAKCTEDKAVNGHNITVKSCEKLINNNGKTNVNQHIITQYCNDCNVEIKSQKEKHRFDTTGNCICGYYDAAKATCTAEKFVEGHKITTKYSYKNITDSATKDEYHSVTQTCSKCKVTHELPLEKHAFNEKGVCTVKGCGYKNALKAKCTEKKYVKEHFQAGYVVATGHQKINNIYSHIVTYKCTLCNIENIASGTYERHKFNDDGVCKCGYINLDEMKCNDERFVETHRIGTYYEGTATGHNLFQRCRACKVTKWGNEEPHDFSVSIAPKTDIISYLLHGKATTKCSACGVLNYSIKEEHSFGTNGVCTEEGCGYKKLVCKSYTFIAEHNRQYIGIRQVNKSNSNDKYIDAVKYHILQYHCLDCDVDVDVRAEHTINADGDCVFCGYHTDKNKNRKCTESEALEAHKNKLIEKYITTDKNTHAKSGFCTVCQKYVILGKNLPHNFVNGVCNECGYKQNEEVPLKLLIARLGTMPAYTMNSEKYNEGIDGFNVANYNGAIGKEELRPGGDGWKCNDASMGLPIDEYSLQADPETGVGYTEYPDIEFVSSPNNTEGLSAQELYNKTLIETSPGCYAHRAIDSNWKDVAVLMGKYTFPGYKNNGHNFNVYFIPEEVCGIEGGCYTMQSGGYAGVDDNWTVSQ